MRRSFLFLVLGLALCIGSMSVAKAEIITYPCGKGTYKVDMPAGVLVDGKTCTGPVVIDSSVKSIASSAFSRSEITSVVIPNSVQSIGSFAFSWTRELRIAQLPASLKIIENYTFEGSKLTSIVIPEGVQSIGWSAFAYNELTSVTIPNSVKKIENYAFGQNRITSVKFGNSLVQLDGGAFALNDLVTIDIPDSLTILGNEVFRENKNLRSIIYCGPAAKYLPTSPTCPADRKAIQDAKVAADNKAAADKAAADKVAADKAAAAGAAAEKASQDAKKLSINCVQGKATKKVVGDNPQCPKGYTNPMAKYPTFQAYAKCKLFKKDYILAGAQLRDNGATLILNAVKEFRYEVSALVERDLNCATSILKMPAFVDAKIGSTRAIDGMQTAQWGKLSAFWNYHPDNGLNITFNSK